MKKEQENKEIFLRRKICFRSSWSSWSSSVDVDVFSKTNNNDGEPGIIVVPAVLPHQ